MSSFSPFYWSENPLQIPQNTDYRKCFAVWGCQQPKFMRPVGTVVVGGLPSESCSSSYPGPGSVSEMSLLHALGPVQTWLGQELEKCGIDAMIYTRYVLSLLLHDSYDYDLQEQVFTSLNVLWKGMIASALVFLLRVLPCAAWPGLQAAVVHRLLTYQGLVMSRVTKHPV